MRSAPQHSSPVGQSVVTAQRMTAPGPWVPVHWLVLVSHLYAMGGGLPAAVAVAQQNSGDVHSGCPVPQKIDLPASGSVITSGPMLASVGPPLLELLS